MANLSFLDFVIMGDFNAHPEEEPRMLLGSDAVEFSYSHYARRVAAKFPSLAEVSGDYFTYKGQVSGERAILSKIDRFWIDM